MNIKDKMEVTRNILHNANKMNFSKEIILEISQKLDEYIVEYYKENQEQKDKR